MGSLKGRDVISIRDFTREELLELFKEADRMQRYRSGGLDILKDKILALAFFEPSTRTMFSFQSAMQKLGGKTISLSEVKKTSIAKGESLRDTILMLREYADALVIRHYIEGAAKYAAEIADIPVINAGDGARCHPTQAMIDLYTIQMIKGRIEGLKVGVLGDLKYGRASNSFIYGLTLFKPIYLYLISPKELVLRQEVKDYLNEVNVTYYEVEDLRSVINELDVLYVTRIQKERFPDPTEYEKVKDSYRVDLSVLKNAKDDLMILHPLPRVTEIPYEVDSTKYAYYFLQASNGVPVRMALLKMILAG